jgi:hypothetical protein
MDPLTDTRPGIAASHTAGPMTASSDTCCNDDADRRCSALAHAITTDNGLAAAPHVGRKPNPYRPSGLRRPRVVSTTAAPRRLGIRSTMCCPIC